METNPKEKKSITLPLLLLFCLLAIATSFGLYHFEYNDKGYDTIYSLGYSNASSQNQTWIQIGVNQTLSNLTLMSEVANNINLYYVNQYGAIPIVYQGRTYKCSNITEVKR